MFAKYFTIAFAILFVFSGTVSSARTDLIATQRGLVDEAQKLIQKLKDMIESQMNAAIDQIKGIYNQIEEIATSAIESAKNTIMEEYNKLMGDIEKIKEEIGSSVGPCIDAQEEKIKNLPNVAMEKLVSCVTDKINEGKDILNNVMDDIKKIPDIVSKIETDLKSCGSFDFLCYGSVIAEATKAIALVPTDIAVQMAKATMLVSTIQASLSACATKQFTAITIEAANIVEDITRCSMNNNN